MCENYYIRLSVGKPSKVYSYLKLIILSIILFQLISFISGFGTHFEHYKYAIMVSIVVLNLVMKKSLPKLNLIGNKNIPRKEKAYD